MRRFTFLLALLGIASVSYGQVAQTGQNALVKQQEIVLGDKINDFKAGGDTIWSTTFDWADETQERGWSLPEGWSIVDNTDFGMPWIWRDDTLGGNFTNQAAPGHFITAENGFICVPVDEYNAVDGVTTSNACDTYIETPPIDCSAYPSVMVNFNHLFRTCCAGAFSMEMQVTNDDWVHQAVYDVRFGIANNTVTPVKYRSPEINISDVAAGLPNIKIRFHWFNGSSHYYWMIDDLTLTEAYQNDLVLEDSWADFNDGADDRVGHINYWPLSQMGGAAGEDIGGFIGDYLFSGALLNNGMSEQENAHVQTTILKNGEQIFQESSDAIYVDLLVRDTLDVNSTFLADDYGDYQITFDALSDNAEEVERNNSSSIMFTVNDTLMHRADFSAEAGVNSGGWVGGANAGDWVGAGYDLFEAAEINSITARIGGVTDDQFPTYQFLLMKYIDDEEGWVEWIVSDIYDADSTIAGTYQTHEMEKDGETEFLEPGFYVAAVRFWGDDGTELGSNGMSIGWDKDNKWNGWYSHVYLTETDAHFNPGKMPMIGVVLNEEGGPTEAAVTFNVDMNAHINNMEFTPGSDFVDVAGTFNNWEGSEAMTDEDGDGIYTLTIEGMPVAERINYRYRINADPATSEYPDDEDGRSYTIRYWNILNNTYNGGQTTGVEDITLIQTLRVYPNPTQGEFTVQIANSDISDLDITLIDLQGHVVYKTRVEGAITHQETIENNFSKGIYFLTVNNGKEVKVQKVIIQ